MKGQVVDVPPSKNATPPKDSRFLAEHNSTVEKETRSRHARPGYDNALSKPSSPAAERSNGAAERERLASGGEGGGGGKAAGSGGRGGTKAGSARVPHQANRDKLALKVDPRGEMRLRDPWQGARGKIDSPDVPGRSGQGREGQAEAPVEGAPGQPQLRPSAASYDRLAGGPAPDRLDGVDEGEGTFLNTREWKYSSYFNRIKQAVATHWDPGNALLKRDPTGQRYAYKDRVTLVTVTLDEAGTLKDVHVQRSSGVDFLDMTAMEAFRKAQPFANPPRGLADEHGEIGFVFGFYLEVGSGFRIFRGPASP